MASLARLAATACALAFALVAVAGAATGAARATTPKPKLPAPTGPRFWPSPAETDPERKDIEVLFTFDDGPNATTTPQVLDILKAHQIRAVFFLVGNMVGSDNKKIPAIIDRILAEGHVIANHTQSHKDLCRVDEPTAVRDIDAGHATIQRVSGIDAAWFRAPFGARCEMLERLLAERKIGHFHWDLDPQEWRSGSDATRVVKYITGELGRAHGRNILLLHDIKRVTVKALPEVLAWIDAENARRAKSRKKKIRIASAPAVALEQMPGLAAWASDATRELRGLPATIAALLP